VALATGMVDGTTSAASAVAAGVAVSSSFGRLGSGVAMRGREEALCGVAASTSVFEATTIEVVVSEIGGIQSQFCCSWQIWAVCRPCCLLLLHWPWRPLIRADDMTEIWLISIRAHRAPHTFPMAHTMSFH
jgi:hypothetical protein